MQLTQCNLDFIKMMSYSAIVFFKGTLVAPLVKCWSSNNIIISRIYTWSNTTKGLQQREFQPFTSRNKQKNLNNETHSSP